MVSFFESLAKGEAVDELRGIFPTQTVLLLLVSVLIGACVVPVIAASVTSVVDGLTVELQQVRPIVIGQIPQPSGG